MGFAAIFDIVKLLLGIIGQVLGYVFEKNKAKRKQKEEALSKLHEATKKGDYDAFFDSLNSYRSI